MLDDLIDFSRQICRQGSQRTHALDGKKAPRPLLLQNLPDQVLLSEPLSGRKKKEERSTQEVSELRFQLQGVKYLMK